MRSKHRPPPDPEPRPLGNESPDPFSPALPPGSLHEILKQEEEQDGQEGATGDEGNAPAGAD